MHDKGATLAVLALLVSSLLASPLSSAQAAAPAADPAPASPPQTGYIYTIRRGDTLWDIAVMHGITLQTLLDANNLTDPTALSVGQTIRVPAPPPTPVPVAETPPDAAQPPSAEDPAAPDAPADPAAVSPEQPASAATGDTVAPVIAVAPELADWPVAVLSAINAHRAEAGLPALAWSDQLAQAAQAHADDCARRNRGSHVGSDGARLRERIVRVGYEPVYASENWANARNTEHAVRMWWNEPASGPHRRNILGPRYTEVGIGVARGAWGYYFVADFAGR